MLSYIFSLKIKYVLIKFIQNYNNQNVGIRGPTEPAGHILTMEEQTQSLWSHLSQFFKSDFPWAALQTEETLKRKIVFCCLSLGEGERDTLPEMGVHFGNT